MTAKIIDFSKEPDSKKWHKYSFQNLYMVWKDSFEKQLVGNFIKINKNKYAQDLSICSSAQQIGEWYDLLEIGNVIQQNDTLYLSPWSNKILYRIGQFNNSALVEHWYPVYSITQNKHGFVNVCSFLYDINTIEIL